MIDIKNLNVFTFSKLYEEEKLKNEKLQEYIKQPQQEIPRLGQDSGNTLQKNKSRCRDSSTDKRVCILPQLSLCICLSKNGT